MREKSFNKRILTLLLLSATVSWSFAQTGTQPGWNDGSLDPVEIEIVTERQIKLPVANRNFEKVPPTPSAPLRPPVTYTFRGLNFIGPEISQLIRPLKLKQESSSNVYGGYLSVGYGNYGSPYLEGFLNSKRNKNKLTGVHVWHASSAKGPVDGENSGSGTSGLSLFGKTFGEHISLKGKMDFENRATHFYGYNPGEIANRDTLRQAYNIFSLGGSLYNTKNTDFAYELGGDFSYLSDKYEARESEAGINFKSSYKISKEQDIVLNSSYFIITRKDALVAVKPRSLFTVNSAYRFSPMEGLKMSTGATVAYENDAFSAKDLHVYPDVEASYSVSPSVDMIGKLSGGIEKVSLHSLSTENLWLAPNVDIFHTNKTLDMLVGINARVGKKVEAHTGLSLASLRNFYYYVNVPGNEGKFKTVYDLRSTKRTNLYASLSYAQTEKAKFMLRGDYYAYAPGTVEQAWHRPIYRLAATGSLNIYQKIIVNAGLIVQGGMKALQPDTKRVVTLSPAIDLNLCTEYLLSESFSIFVQMNNIVSKNYPVFLNYPVRGFQVTGGLTWSF